jgi:uncharacterized phage protein (TIGR01671 family)
MNKIKFKFWDETNKKMIIYQSWLIFNYYTGRIFDKHIRDFRDDLIKLQYTGLKDKKGKEIFEGDIVKAENKFKHLKICGQIKYMWGSFYIKSESLKCYFINEIINSDFEILGNIYKNPEILELIEKEKE